MSDAQIESICACVMFVFMTMGFVYILTRRIP